MAHAGETIENPVDGERLIFARTVEDTGDDELVIEYYIPLGTPAVPAHVHLASEETFEVLAGTLEVWTGSRRNRRHLQAGERITLSPHVPHQHGNGGSDVLHVRETFRPAGNLEIAFQATFGLARDGKATRTGLPKNLLDTALILQLLGIVPAGLPLPVARVGVNSVASLARSLGREQSYPKYSHRSALLAPIKS
jgi:mannose-6-phosphate isomerase-like protein (cupin superfamily)